MAKVVLPFMSQAARGKLGPIVANQWRSINTMKVNKAPTNPRTAAQLSARASFASASQAWAALTSSQRDAWNTYAVDHLLSDWTGQPLRLTGQNWFVKCYTLVALVGGAAITDPPTESAPASPTALVLANAGGAGTPMTLDWTLPAAAGTSLVVFACGPFSVGRLPRREQAAKVAVIASETVGAQQILAAPVAGRYGVWVKAVDESCGLASQEEYVEITVT